MREPLTVGILKETKNRFERRTPLIPEDAAWLMERGIQVEVMASPQRIYPDEAYQKAGARVVPSFEKAKLLLGVKEPPIDSLLPGKIYAVFSHTAKGQQSNRFLLKSFLKKHITLLDYEYIRDKTGNRVVYFGRFAGICGMIDSLHFLGKRLEFQGIPTPLCEIKRAFEYGDLRKARKAFLKVSESIKAKGFPEALSPFIVGITGHGNVSKGAQEILKFLSPIEIHPRDIHAFVKHQKGRQRQIYKIVFTREEKIRAKDGEGFYFEEYLENPENFESNLDQYLPYLAMLIHGSYWNKKYPRLVTEKMIRDLYHNPKSRLQLIGDLTCDVKGGIEITKKATDPDHAVFVYNPVEKTLRDGHEGKGMAVLAVDNLPAEFSKDASDEFSRMIRDYVYQIAQHGAVDLDRHHALPAELRRAVICQNGKLTEPFRYLNKFVPDPKRRLR